MVVDTATRVCSGCGFVSVAEEWPEGLCPRCLLGLALEDTPPEHAERFDPRQTPAESPEMGSIAPGSILENRYRVRSRVGHGGMGEVWRVVDLKLQEDLALKTLRSRVPDDGVALRSMRQEVRKARAVISPNVCRVFDLVEIAGREMVAMEFVDGINLARLLESRGPLEFDEAREIAAQLLVGLEAIHEAGLVHRDIKPENLMITRSGRVVVMDFGIAAREGEEVETAVSGTPAYVAPELHAGGCPDARSDVYAVGVVLAEMVSAGGPGRGETREEVWRQIRQGSLTLGNAAWMSLVKKATSRSPEQRYPSAAALACALDAVALRIPEPELESPYPGLAAFTEEQAGLFFGRELEVEQMWKKMGRPRLLGLIGPSGAGKTSFLRAGLLTAAPEGWGTLVLTPRNDPFGELGSALERKAGRARDAFPGTSPVPEREGLLHRLLQWRRRHDQALVVIDQFEELFSRHDAETQSRFSELLRDLVVMGDTHVLISMRDDFLFLCSGQPGLAAVFSDLTPLRLPTGGSLRRAVVQPALKSGYRFEDESLVEAILSGVSHDRAALPLLAFAAARLWDHRDREQGLLTRRAYEAIGGVGGALAQHAEETLERIGRESVPIVRELFRNLVSAGGTRVAREYDEILSVFADHLSIADPEHAAHILDLLVDARLLTSYEAAGAEKLGGSRHYVEVIHESLLTHWPRLVRWQAQDADSVQLRDELRQAAHLWQSRGRPDDLLWSGASFRELRAWRERYRGHLSRGEREFVREMTVKVERRQRRRRAARLSVLILLLAIVSIVGGLWLRSAAETRRAEAGNLLSQAQLRLDRHPTAALALGTASLEMADSEAARHVVLEALLRGPPELRIPHGSEYSIEFSADGRWLALASPTEGCTVWPREGGPPVTLEGTRVAMEAQISPTGDLVAVTMDRERRELGLWSLPEGKFLRSIAGDEPGSTYFFRFSPDGTRLLYPREIIETDHVEYEFRSWPVAGGEPRLMARVLASRDSSSTFAGFDAKGTRLAWVDGKELMIVPVAGEASDLASAVPLAHDAIVSFAAFSADGTHVATVDEAETLYWWSLVGPDPVLLWKVHHATGALWTLLRVDPSGTWLAHGQSRLWRLDAPPEAEPMRIFRAAGVAGESVGGHSIAFDPSGNWFATAGDTSSSLWPLTLPQARVLRGHEKAPYGRIHFVAGGTQLVSRSHPDGSVRLWSLGGRAGARSRVLYRATRPTVAPMVSDVSADGSTVVIGTPSGEVHRLSLEDGAAMELSGFSDAIQSVALSPSGRRVAAGAGFYAHDQAVVRVWDSDTDAAWVLDAQDGLDVGLVRFVGEDELWAGSGSTLRRWDLRGREARLQDQIDLGFDSITDGGVLDIDLGSLRALILSERRLFIHDLAAGSTRQLKSHGSLVVTASFDASGEMVVSGDTLGWLRVGSVEGSEPHLFVGHRSPVSAIGVSGEGRWVASAAGDGAIRLWPMPDVGQPPLHTLPRRELLARLHALTNLRAVQDPESATGWSLEVGPFPGWERAPDWYAHVTNVH